MVLQQTKKNLLLLFKKYNLDLYNTKSLGLAFSGGTDSSFLLDVLIKLKDELNFTISLLYVEHNIRDKNVTKYETTFIENIAKKYSINLYKKKFDTDELLVLSKKESKSLEELAREKRYNFFAKIQKEKGLDLIALAHHKDDNRETVLMRFIDNSWITGLKGIPENRDYFIRPILNIEKNTILTYLKENSIPYLLDESNKDEKYKRNYIRNTLIPELTKYKKSFVNSLDNFSEKMILVDDFFKIEADKVKIEKYFFDSFYINYNDFASLHSVIKITVVYKILNLIFCNNEHFSFSFVKRVIILKEKYIESSNIIVEICNDRIYFSKKRFLNFNDFSDFNLKVFTSNFIDKSANLWINKESVVGDLKVRSYENSDFILTDCGTKKVSDIFCDWKIPRFLRNSIPIIYDDSGIVAIIARSLGFRNRIRKNVKIVETNQNLLYYIVTDIIATNVRMCNE